MQRILIFKLIQGTNMLKTSLLLHGLMVWLKQDVYLIRSRKSRNDSTSSKGSDGKLSRLSTMDVAILVANAEPNPAPSLRWQEGVSARCSVIKYCAHVATLLSVSVSSSKLFKDSVFDFSQRSLSILKFFYYSFVEIYIHILLGPRKIHIFTLFIHIITLFRA